LLSPASLWKVDKRRVLHGQADRGAELEPYKTRKQHVPGPRRTDTDQVVSGCYKLFWCKHLQQQKDANINCNLAPGIAKLFLWPSPTRFSSNCEFLRGPVRCSVTALKAECVKCLKASISRLPESVQGAGPSRD
jgi:hypothetical protein